MLDVVLIVTVMIIISLTYIINKENGYKVVDDKTNKIFVVLDDKIIDTTHIGSTQTMVLYKDIEDNQLFICELLKFRAKFKIMEEV